jgi:DNA (cytosine-5)-methyltransferase 1
MEKHNFISFDLFSGAGGLTEGLREAGFDTKFAFEINEMAAKAYSMNHESTVVITKDIRDVNGVDMDEIKNKLNGLDLHLLAGCPPCQGFSSVRRLNKLKPVADPRNDLINEYVRFVEYFKPYTIMLENVPWLGQDDLFAGVKKKLEEIEYNIDVSIVNVKDYGVPQKRKRLVLIGSRLGPISIAKPNKENKKITVHDCIGALPKSEESDDKLHKIFPHHTPKIQELIKDIPHDGGSRRDLGEDRQLKCHMKKNVGFYDIYGRLRWDDYSSTITGGCLNPSKGRFLHPEQDRCISAREAALLQSFPPNYKFPTDVPISSIALMIGNALPPKFAYYQAKNIRRHLLKHLEEIK